MVTELPVRLQFELPQGWHAAPPDEVGAPGAAFVAQRAGTGGSFTANITVAGTELGTTTLDALANESVERLEQVLRSVHLRDRTEIGSPDAPGLTQVLDLIAVVDEEPLELVQCQVYLSMIDRDDPAKRAVIELVLTCTPAQLDLVLGEFQEFVRTVAPESS